VAVADLDSGRGRTVQKEIESLSAKSLAIPCDVTSAADCRRMVEQTIAALGRLDVLFTSAGLHGGGRTVEDTTLETWDRVLGVDLKGAYLSTKFAIPEMRRCGGGAVNRALGAYLKAHIPPQIELELKYLYL
jgi:NAD(P)-dependent dehydrogenase (short-subunit alcohol dehydrogenase family)